MERAVVAEARQRVAQGIGEGYLVARSRAERVSGRIRRAASPIPVTEAPMAMLITARMTLSARSRSAWIRR